MKRGQKSSTLHKSYNLEVHERSHGLKLVFIYRNKYIAHIVVQDKTNVLNVTLVNT